MLDPTLPAVDPGTRFGRLLIQLEREGLLAGMNEICVQHGALLEDIFGESARAHISRARHLVWWWLVDEKGWSYRAIGGLFEVSASGVGHGARTAERALGLASDGRGRRAA